MKIVIVNMPNKKNEATFAVFEFIKDLLMSEQKAPMYTRKSSELYGS